MEAKREEEAFDEVVSVCKETLDVEEFFTDYSLDRNVFNNVSVREVTENMLRHVVLRFKYRVLSKSLEDAIIKHPKTWWDAFKERWFPERLKERFPVTYKVHEFRADALYPNFAVQEDSFGEEFYYQESREYEEVNVD